MKNIFDKAFIFFRKMTLVLEKMSPKKLILYQKITVFRIIWPFSQATQSHKDHPKPISF